MSRHLLVLLLCLFGLTSCVTRGFPGHGGGKRFFVEQHLVSKSVELALDELDWSAIPRGGPVRVWVVAIGDEGGGSSVGKGVVGGFQNLGMGTGVDSVREDDFTTMAFANTRDVEYVRGLVSHRLDREGVQVHRDWHARDARIAGDLYVLVGEFGIAASGFQLFVYSERKLEARTALKAHFIENPEGLDPDQHPRFVFLGEGSATTWIYEEYVFLMGPINSPSERYFSERGPVPGSL